MPTAITMSEAPVRPRSVVVRTRKDWANDAKHAASFPEHLDTCPVCSLPFDARVNAENGLHHEKRRALYCSPTCQRTAEARRERRGRGASPTHGLTIVLRNLKRKLGLAHWTKLELYEWRMLEAHAPQIARGVAWYEDGTTKQRRAVGYLNHHPELVETMKRELIARIDEWSRSLTN